MATLVADYSGVTGVGCGILLWKMEVNGKWGQVIGNIVAEWVQMSGLIFLTKALIEKGSKEKQNDTMIIWRIGNS